MLSRVASITSRSFVRAISKQTALIGSIKPRYITSIRSASTQSEIKNELIEALENEIKAEKNLESDNLGGSTRPSVAGFQIATDQAEVRLTKSFGNEKILVIFNVNHSVDVEDDEENPDGGLFVFSINL